jgi:hypothetical protein
MTVEIALSRGLVALVDDEDEARVTSYGKWYAHQDSKTFYARKNYWLAGRCLSVRMHKVILGLELIDHINGNGLDNRRTNLRPATSSQNAMNRGLRSDNTSGFKGVYWHRSSGCWAATIQHGDQRQHLGLFSSPIDAALAYDAAALHHFGEFARPNFPNEVSA